MKAIKLFLLILFCCCGARVVYSQQKADWVPDSIAAQVPLIRGQADEWKQKTKEDPANEKAWFCYAQRIQSLQVYTPGEAMEREKKELLEGAKRSIPNTATYAITRMLLDPDSRREMSFNDIMDKWPDAVLLYPTYLGLSMNDRSRQKDICIRWYQSGTFPSPALNFSYNELVSADKDALIFTTANWTMFGCNVLQYGKGMFEDKRFVLVTLLLSSPGMDELTNELGIPKYTDDNPGFYKSSTPATTFAEEIKKRVDHIIKHTKRSVYISASMDESVKALFKDHLYPEGLLLKYSEKPYDNLAIMRRNFEHTYLLDYLKESFTLPTGEMTFLDSRVTESFSFYYIPAFKSLLRFYKESGDQTNHDKLYQLLQSIVMNAKYCDGNTREKYLKSINIQ